MRLHVCFPSFQYSLIAALSTCLVTILVRKITRSQVEPCLINSSIVDQQGYDQPPFDDEDDESEEEEGWGTKKSAYYASNAEQLESDDEEANELEEQEAKRLQSKARDAMADDDFGLGDVVEGAPEADGYAARCMHVCACSSLTVLQTRRRTCAASSAAAAARQAFSSAASGEDEPGSTGVGP